MSTKISKVTTRPELDPYHADTGQETNTALYIDPERNLAALLQEYDDNATPSDEWHGVVICELLHARPDEDAARTCLEEAEGQALLATIIDHHNVVWDGSNHVGSLDDEGQDALDTLLLELADLPACEWELWSVDDWLEMYSDPRLTADATDETLAVMAAELEEQAETENVILHGDISTWLKEMRQQLIYDNISEQLNDSMRE